MTTGPYGLQGTPAGAQPPVCPRHPDRISYVTCQRCGRPACPECQRPAAVGIQCVDCVALAAKATRAPRTVFGGQVRAGRPLVTWTIIGVTAAVFLLQFIPQLDLTYRLGYAPSVTYAEPWRLLTSVFLHSTSFLPHIAFNMYAVWILGQALEPMLGRARFLSLYLITGLGGSVGVLLLASPTGPAWTGLVVGASGAIFGLFGALFVIQHKLGGSVRQILVLIVINGVLGFVVPGIAWQAHLGGLLTGALAGLVIAHAPRQRRTLVQAGGLALIVVILLVLVVVKMTSVGAVFA